MEARHYFLSNSNLAKPQLVLHSAKETDLFLTISMNSSKWACSSIIVLIEVPGLVSSMVVSMMSNKYLLQRGLREEHHTKLYLAMPVLHKWYHHIVGLLGGYTRILPLCLYVDQF